MSFGSELRWPTTHFVKPFNTLEHACPPLKVFFFLSYKSTQKWKAQNVSAFKVNPDILWVVLNAWVSVVLWGVYARFLHNLHWCQR